MHSVGVVLWIGSILNLVLFQICSCEHYYQQTQERAYQQFQQQAHNHVNFVSSENFNVPRLNSENPQTWNVPSEFHVDEQKVRKHKHSKQKNPKLILLSDFESGIFGFPY